LQPPRPDLRDLALAFLYGAGAVLPLLVTAQLGAAALGDPYDTDPLFGAVLGLLAFAPGVLLTLAAGLALRRTPLYAWVTRQPALLWALVALALLLVFPAFVDTATREPDPNAANGTTEPSFPLVGLAAIELSIALTWLMARGAVLGIGAATLLAVALLAAAGAA
jgi:hypothetical protein